MVAVFVSIAVLVDAVGGCVDRTRVHVGAGGQRVVAVVVVGGDAGVVAEDVGPRHERVLSVAVFVDVAVAKLLAVAVGVEAICWDLGGAWMNIELGVVTVGHVQGQTRPDTVELGRLDLSVDPVPVEVAVFEADLFEVAVGVDAVASGFTTTWVD